MNNESSNSPAFNYDPYLYMLVCLVEDGAKDGSELPQRIPLILTAGGSLVTGILTTQKVFFERSNSIFRILDKSKTEGDEETAIKGNITLSQLAKVWPKFIHLESAQFLTPDMQNANDPALCVWRGRLDRIDGWMIVDEKIMAILKEQVAANLLKAAPAHEAS